MSALEEMVRRYSARLASSVEIVCQASLLDPAGRGVLARQWPGGFSVSLSAEVPAGAIHWHHLPADPDGPF